MPPIVPYFEDDQPADFLQGGYEEGPVKLVGGQFTNVAHMTDSFVQSPFGSRNANLVSANRPLPGPVCPLFFFLDWKEYDETNGYHEPIGGQELFGRTRLPLQHPYYTSPTLYFEDMAVLRQILELSNGREGGFSVDWRFPGSGLFHPRANPNWKLIVVLTHGEMRHHELPGGAADGEDSWFVEGTDFGRIVPHGLEVPVSTYYLAPSVDQFTWTTNAVGSGVQVDPLPNGTIETHLRIPFVLDNHATTLPVYGEPDFVKLLNGACPSGIQALGYLDDPSRPDRRVFVACFGYVDTEQFFHGVMNPTTRENAWIGQGRAFNVTRDIIDSKGNYARRLFGQVQGLGRTHVEFGVQGYRGELWQIPTNPLENPLLTDGEYAGARNDEPSGLYLRYFGDQIYRYVVEWFPWLDPNYNPWVDP